MGLRLRRKIGETVLIGPDIEVTVIATRKGEATLCVEAPEELWVVRAELIEEPRNEQGSVHREVSGEAPVAGDAWSGP
jgi:carbon storage regulator CsrA